MLENYTYIDFDGVILDSQKRMLERKALAGFKDQKSKEQFDLYFEYTNNHPEEWEYIINRANQINNSVDIIQKLQSLNKRIAILTKIHTLYEMKVKVRELRENRNIYVPVIFVPPGIKKYEVVIPNNQLLIDDSKKNIQEWIQHGGQGLIFDEYIDVDTDSKVKSLEFLLKR